MNGSWQGGDGNEGSISHKSQVYRWTCLLCFPSWCTEQTDREVTVALPLWKNHQLSPELFLEKNQYNAVSFIIQAFRQKLRRGGSTSNSSVSYLQVSEANNRFALTTTFAQWASYNKYSGYRQLCLQGTSSFVLLPVLSLQIAFALPAGQHTALLSELDTFSEAVSVSKSVSSILLCPEFQRFRIETALSPYLLQPTNLMAVISFDNWRNIVSWVN